MHLLSYVSRLSIACPLVLALSGCMGNTIGAPSTAAPASVTGAAIQGRVRGGQQAISDAHVYLLAASTSGYGGPGIAPAVQNASQSLLSAAATGHSDSIGAYVLTDGNGNFSITGDYSCTPNTQVYLYALGGNPGLTSGTDNAAAGLLAALGNCPTAGNFLTATPYVVINEVSTIATAYAFAGFATDATHVSSSGTALAQTGIANAFATAANLETLSTGVALATTPAGNGTVPEATINTLANILAACVNTNGAVTGPASPTPCYTLFNSAMSGGSSGTVPSDTASAAINIAHNPAVNIAALYGLQSGVAAFQPTIGAEPNDFTIGLAFTGGGLGLSISIAIDGSGNAWIANYGQNSVTKLSNSGSALSGQSGYMGGGLDKPDGIAIDGSANAWITNQASPSNINSGLGTVTELSNSGSILSGASGFSGGALNTPSRVAIDSAGNAWVTNAYYGGGTVTELSNSGAVLSGVNGFTGGGLDSPWAIAIDGSGNAWVANGFLGGGSVTELSSSGSVLSGTNGLTGGGISTPNSIAVDRSGGVWVTDAPGMVTHLSSSGSFLSGANGYSAASLIGPTGIAIDGSGNAWIVNTLYYGGGITELSNSGSVLSGANGFTGSWRGDPSSPLNGWFYGPQAIAIDGSGNVWVANYDQPYASELIGAATPVITPICAGLPATPTTDGSSKLGTRP